MELQKGLPFLRAQTRYGPAQLNDAAGVASIPQHRIDACGAQAWMLLESLANEPQVGIGQGCPYWGSAPETLAFDGIAHRVGVHTKFGNDGADLPVFGEKIPPDLRTSFWTDH